jgi:hypothetical protein
MKRYNFLSIVISFIFFFSGCSEDFLDTKSTSKVDEDAIFANTETAIMAVNGIHKLMWTGSLSTSAFYGGYDMLMIWNEMMSDDLIYTYDNAQFYLQAAWTGHRNITAGSLAHFYRVLMYMISNSNTILGRVDALPGTQSERDNIKGQAYFYRAFAYYTMVQMWGERYKAEGNNTQLGIVMRNDNSTEPRARASVEEVYTQVNADVEEAIHFLSATTVQRPNKSHINVHVARGLKARVLLTQGKFLEAAEMAKLVVANSGAKLQDDTYTTTDNRFSDQKNTEWLWGSHPSLLPVTNLTHFHGYMSNENVSYNQNTPRAINSLLYKKISNTDIRKTIWFPNGGITTVLPRPLVPPSTNSKYANYMANKFIVTDPATIGNRDIPFMRLPEMMLIVAEGYARAGGHDADAAAAFYPLAKHRDPAYVQSTKTGADLIEEIMFQRRVELWGEGFRWYDMKRLNLALNRGPAPREGYNQAKWPNGGLAAMPANEDPEASNFWRYSPVPRTDQPREIPAGDKRWQWYIPNSEIELNPLCEQNEL